jgi:hypothetical protein
MISKIVQHTAQQVKQPWVYIKNGYYHLSKWQVNAARDCGAEKNFFA